MSETTPTTAPAPAAPPPDASAPAEAWSEARRLGAWLNALVMTVLVLAILVGLNYASDRHFRRYDWTADQEFKLSDLTVSTLRGLRTPVEIDVVVVNPEVSPDEWNAQARLSHMLDEYKLHVAQPSLLTIDKLGFGMERTALQAKMQRLKLQTFPANQSVVVYADDHSKTLSISDLYEHDFDPTGRGSRMKAWKGEAALTAAIRELTQEKAPVVYFAQGHGAGEGKVRRDEAQDYPPIAWIVNRLKERENIEHRELNLAKTSAIPDDCRILVIHNPTVPYDAREIAVLGDFLKRGGRLCVMVDPLSEKGFLDTGLEGLLKDWGVAVGRNLVLVRGMDMFGRDVTVPYFDVEEDDYAPHPIVDRLRKAKVRVRMIGARTVGKAEGADSRLTVQPLITIPEGAWGETNLDQYRRRQGAPDAEDVQGAISVAQAVEAPLAPGVEKSISAKTRLVVFGNAMFVTDADQGGVRNGANEDLFVGALLWLIDRERDIGIGGKTLSDRRITLEEKHQKRIFWGCVVGMPAFSVLFGLALWFVRRK